MRIAISRIVCQVRNLPRLGAMMDRPLGNKSSKEEAPPGGVCATPLVRGQERPRARSEYAKALALQQRALAIREKALGPEHPDVALSLAILALASTDAALGQYREGTLAYVAAPKHAGSAALDFGRAAFAAR